MNSGLIRRAVAFFADLIVIASIVSISFSLIAQPLYQNSVENFDTLYAEYERLENERAEELIALNEEEYELNEDLDNGDIEETEYETEMDSIRAERDDIGDKYSVDNYPEEYGVGNSYLAFSIFYHIGTFLLFHVLYMIILKGHSIGRKLMKLKLVGHVNPFTILLREFFWKWLFYTFTLGIGLLIDIYMIILRADKKTLRDMFSRTRVILEDINYPF
ncbi:MAG: RDD family protein [Bacillota bacterium]